MQTVQLGSSDLLVSLACLGTMTFGNQNDEKSSFELLDYAVKQGGINFIDTAELYPVPPAAETCGSTEDIIGRWLAKEGPEMRKKVILASKVSGRSGRKYIVANRKDPKQEEADSRLSRDQIFEAIDGSLRRLQTDYLDLYQLHWPDRYTPNFGELGYERAKERSDDVSFEEQVQAMGDLIASGKIRHWGVSNENAFGVTKFVETAKKLGVPPPVSIQNDFSLADRRFHTDGTAEACAPHNVPGGIGLLAYGALSGGTLSGKYLGDQKEAKTARHTLFEDFQPRYHSNRTMTMAAAHVEIAKKWNVTPSQLAYAWAASREYMASVIIGATTLEQLKENVAAFTMEIPSGAIEEVDNLHLEYERPYFDPGLCRLGRKA